MREFEIYLPLTANDGTPIDGAKIQWIKDTLVQAFGGYTHFDQRSEGVWRMGGVTFRDQITIVRVLDDGAASFDMPSFKREIERLLAQESVLVIARNVAAV